MNTDLFYHFRTVYEAGTIAKASEQLHLTAGALSRAIKRLEYELGHSLFITSGRNIVPTEDGRKFYFASAAIIDSIENAKKSLKGLPKSNDLKIASFEVFSTHFMSWMIHKINFEEKVSVLERVPGEIERAVLDGEVDFGITYIPEANKELDHLFIGTMEMGIFSNKPREDLPFAIPITELGINSLQVKSLDGWPLNKERTVKYGFEMLETALDLSSRGMARICCPRFLIKIENERLNEKHKLHEVEVKPKVLLPRFKVYVIKKKSVDESVTFKKMTKALRMALL